MREHGMPFRPDMAAALRNGMKTQHRIPIAWMGYEDRAEHPDIHAAPYFTDDPDLGWTLYSRKGGATWNALTLPTICPWRAGDRIYVREDFQPDLGRQDHNLVWYKSDYSLWEIEKRDGIYHSKDTGIVAEDGHQFWWARAENMKPWAARTWLEITDIRAQRIQEISADEAAAEGFPPGHPAGPIHWLWGILEDIYPGCVDRNDWFWVLDLKLIEKGGAE